MIELTVRPPCVWDETIKQASGMPGGYRYPTSREEFLAWCREFGTVMREEWKPWIRVCRGIPQRHVKKTLQVDHEWFDAGPQLGMAFVATKVELHGTVLIYGASACHPKDGKRFNRHEGLYRAYKNRNEATLDVIQTVAEAKQIEPAAAAIQLMETATGKRPHNKVIGTLVGMLVWKLNELQGKGNCNDPTLLIQAAVGRGDDIHTDLAKKVFRTTETGRCSAAGRSPMADTPKTATD